MSGLVIACDRAEGLTRASVWSGASLTDLYLDRVATPDFTGAVARGKIVRVLPGQKAGWVEAGLPQKLYLESKTPLTAGEIVTARIQTTLGEGKAWAAAPLATEEGEGPVGLVAPPPAPWQRALADVPPGVKISLRFGDKEDYESCLRARPDLAPVLSKEPVHPDLDERIEPLLVPRVVLPGGASLVIETTSALTAIDVNAGEGGTSTSVNLLAVREAARQIRLRNLSGLIVIDALKMKDRADAAKMLNALKRACADDPAGVAVFGLTKLGLIELTRTRRGPSLGEIYGGAR